MSESKERMSAQNAGGSEMQPDEPMTEWLSLIKHSWIWFAAAAVLLIGGSIYAVYAYDRIPDPIVAHWNLAMDPDRYAVKSLVRVLAISGTGILIVLILFLFSWIVRITVVSGYTKLGGYDPIFDPSRTSSTEESQDPGERVRIQKLLFYEYVRHAIGMESLLISLMFCAALLRTMNPSAIPSVGMVVVIYGAALLMIAIPIILMLTAGVGGHKLDPSRSRLVFSSYAIGHALIVTALFAYLVTIYQVG